MTQHVKYLDLNKAIRESDSGLLKKLPGFVVSLLKRIIHEDEINTILNNLNTRKGVDFHNAVIEYMNLSVEIEGLENLPSDGRCFFIANHPFGVADGLILTKTVLDAYGDFRGIGNDAFRYIPNLTPYIAVVNAYGTTSRSYLEELEKLFAADIPVTHFPAGEVSRRYKGRIQDREWRKSVITRAVVHHRDIVPFYFHGANSRLFYSVFTVRKLLGIQLNLELALLPHEFFNKRNKKLKVTIGKPISWQEFDNRHSHQEWADLLKNHVYSLKNNASLSFSLQEPVQAHQEVLR